MLSPKNARRSSKANDQMGMTMNALHRIFYPKSIAIVGASKDPTKRGFRSIQKLLEDGFKGAIYPVNPK
jgi:acetate---CoA ligase (ADP-forming)